jgi:hypothetical protein
LLNVKADRLTAGLETAKLRKADNNIFVCTLFLSKVTGTIADILASKVNIN